MTRNSYVSFKGNKDGISIYLNAHADFIDLKNHLTNKLDSAKQFFAGAKVISIQGESLSEEEKKEIKNIIHTEYGMEVMEDHPTTVKIDKKEEKVFDGIEEGTSKFIHATIRSGQRIYFKGNVIVIGDVNPGAEVVADGNILVMGNLRGVAHAGANGNEKAFVAAYSLQPTQLRIANIITRSPDNEKIRPICPELACIKGDGLVIEPYLPNK